MASYVILFIATLFALWILNRTEDPQIFYNAILAINCAILFIILIIGVFELCGCVM